MAKDGDAPEKKTARSFGTVLRRHRDGLALSQEKVAEASGLDRTYISMLERGVHQPSLHTLLRLADALGVPADQLTREVVRELDGG